MGIVKSQSITNAVVTYIGFGLGAINVLFLFTNLLTDAYYGLVTYIFSTANILLPLVALGTHNAIIKFYSSFSTNRSKNQLLGASLLLPLLAILPLLILSILFYNPITDWLSSENSSIKTYAYLILISAVSFSYFEIFYAWSKVKLKSTFGNFMKEIFNRLCTTLLLILFYFNLIGVTTLLFLLVGVYILRMFIMAVYAIKLVNFSWVRFGFNEIKPILNYSIAILVAGSVANLILEIDKFMLSKYISIENIAYYGVAVFMATVIAVPLRAMHQITYPITASFINENNISKLNSLYKKSSISLFTISGLLFLLLVLNKPMLYYFLPDSYSVAFSVLVILGFAKVIDALMGISNAILFSSPYYKLVLLFGVLLVILTIGLNLFLIPKFGILGAAYATFIALLMYNATKLIFIFKAYRIVPFTKRTLLIFLLIISIGVVFSFWETNWNVALDFSIKSTLIGVAYVLGIYKVGVFKSFKDVLKLRY